MNTALCTKITVATYDGKEEIIYSTSGDFIRSTVFFNKNLSEVGENISNVLHMYALTWYALNRLGKLKKYGIGEELNLETLYEMADAIALSSEDVTEKDVHFLAEQQKKK